MRRSAFNLGALVLGGACAFAPVPGGAQTMMGGHGHGMMSGNVSSADRQFIRMAAEINHGEVQSGTLAQQRGTTPAVRQLGKLYVDDHTTNQNKLTTLAQRLNVSLPGPTRVTPEDKMASERLATLHGRAFDMTWLSDEKKGHETAIQAYKQAADSSNSTVAAYAKKSLPVLEGHLRLATTDAGALQGGMHSMGR